jgi:NAD-dependent SIR2 family protein deacetylase
MTSAGGVCYTDPMLAARWYPEYYSMGRKSIAEIMGDFWPTTINKRNAAAFWGFWAKHIHHIRYEPKALQPYQDLRGIVGDKEHFICSTNVDGQLEKAGFDKANIFAPQGDYALFQCEKPCSQDVYNNRAMVDAMLENILSPLEVRQEDIPRCPRCGRFLIPNLRCDYRFVEKPHLHNMKSYEAFIKDSQHKRLVLLELGVGFNTPVIIRYPFERIAESYPSAILVRINDRAAGVPREIEDRAMRIQGDLLTVMREIGTTMSY